MNENGHPNGTDNGKAPLITPEVRVATPEELTIKRIRSLAQQFRIVSEAVSRLANGISAPGMCLFFNGLEQGFALAGTWVDETLLPSGGTPPNIAEAFMSYLDVFKTAQKDLLNAMAAQTTIDVALDAEDQDAADKPLFQVIEDLAEGAE